MKNLMCFFAANEAKVEKWEKVVMTPKTQQQFKGIKRAQRERMNIIISALSLFVVLIKQVHVTESEKNDNDENFCDKKRRKKLNVPKEK